MRTFTFTNASSSTCWLRGWPSFQVKGAGGKPTAVSTVRVRQTVPPAPALLTVVLRRGGTASFDVYGADWNPVANQPCPQTSALSVTPPGDSSALLVAVRILDCHSFEVAPVVGGSKDRQAWSRVVK